IAVVVLLAILVATEETTLLIKGPTKPVLEGESVTLECLSSDPELNISQVHFEIFSKYMQTWRPIQERSWCYYTVQIKQTPESLVLSIPHAGSFYEGPYRCVSNAENVTEPERSSEVLAFKVHCECLGYLSYFGASQELVVRVGEDVVLKCSTSSSEEPSYTWKKNGYDWILPSSVLTLKKVSTEDQGQYTCMAKHPSVESFSKSRSISITVLPENASWYKTSNGRLMLMTSVAAATLLVFILSVSVFLCRRARKTTTSKGPIDDRSQKKPIYKSSAESLPSTCGDKQPLV
uniref:Ig-like domain-containing protein n=1 Tax=Mola mola TaxID=94237 RepID=A0A3Q3WAC5_MOLML